MLKGGAARLAGEMLHDINPSNGGTQAGQNIGLYQSWISGFVSGINYARSDIYDISGATSPNDSFDWIKNYCERNLNQPIPAALHELILQWNKEGRILTKEEEQT